MCAVIDGLSPVGGDVRCIGCDGSEYVFGAGSISMLGQLGRGTQQGVVGGTDADGNNRGPSPILMDPLVFPGSDTCESTAQPPMLAEPLDGAVVQVPEGSTFVA